MMEILSPAGSHEAAVAAVQNGADAIYLGYGKFNARRNAANFDDNGLRSTVDYCHLRGVKVYLTLNTLLSDQELPQAARLVRLCSDIGVDALIVQDLGAVEMIRQVAPDLPVHGSTQMTVHNLDGVMACAAMGMERVVLSRELSRQQLRYICRHSPIEIEVFVHGALCMCYSGQCFLSSAIGGRSGNRGMCAQPCRMKYGWEGSADSYPLSLKDMSLVRYLRELEEMGVASAKIEGRMKRPEYVAIVTKVYSDVLRQGRQPTREEQQALLDAFHRQGFTDGYYLGKTGPGMFGIHEKEPAPEKRFAQVRQECRREHPRVPVDMALTLRPGAPVELTVTDGAGHTATAAGPMPQAAQHRPVGEEQIRQQLQRTGGTPYLLRDLEVRAVGGLSVPVSALNGLRRRVLDDLSMERIRPPQRRTGELTPPERIHGQEEPPVYTLSIRRGEQLSDGLLDLHPQVIYLAPEEILARRGQVVRAMDRGIEICAALPRILWDNERADMVALLEQVKELGVYTALVGDLGALTLAISQDFTCRGDFGLGVYNSMTLAQLREMGLVSATLSFEQRLARVRDLSKPIDTELLVYGRLPLMITQNRPRPTGRAGGRESGVLTDRTGAQFPVLPARGGRSELFNSKKLFLGDKPECFQSLGLWAARLSFTTENSRECVQLLERYQGRGSYAPADITRGLYFRDVE